MSAPRSFPESVTLSALRRRQHDRRTPRRRRRRWRRTRGRRGRRRSPATMASPSPAPRLAALAPALGAPEALEQRRSGRRWAGRGRGRAPRGAPRRPRGATVDVDRAVRPACARARCGRGCRAPGAAGGRRRARPRGRRRGRSIGAVGRGRAGVGDRVAGEVGEVDLGVRGVDDLVEPRERQQVLDEHAHARRLVLDPPHRLLDVLAARARRPCGTARRSRGSRPAACAARARRRR